LAQPVGSDDPALGGDHTIGAIASVYDEEIAALAARGPIALGGFSFGSLVAVEGLRRLPARGVALSLLVSVARAAPGYPEFLPLAPRFVSHVRHFLGATKEKRRIYVRDRIVNLRRRVYRVFDREHELAPEALLATPEMREQHEKIWEVNFPASRS